MYMYIHHVLHFPHAGMLMWFCQDAKAVQRICKGGENIKAEETNKESIPDDVVDVNIAILENFFAKDAWTIVQHGGRELQKLTSISVPLLHHILNIVELKRKEWQCGACTQITAKANMIM